MSMRGKVATAEVDVDAAPGRVWQALTDPAEVKEWMAGTTLKTDWQVGSLITWSGEYDGRSYQDKGEVVAYDEPRELSVTHFSPLTGQEDVPENYHTLVYTLNEESGRTQLRLSQDNCADEDEAEKFSENWQQMLDGIKAHIES